MVDIFEDWVIPIIVVTTAFFFAKEHGPIVIALVAIACSLGYLLFQYKKIKKRVENNR